MTNEEAASRRALVRELRSKLAIRWKLVQSLYEQYQNPFHYFSGGIDPTDEELAVLREKHSSIQASTLSPRRTVLIKHGERHRRCLRSSPLSAWSALYRGGRRKDRRSPVC